jgi:putative ABC transport system permease protein
VNLLAQAPFVLRMTWREMRASWLRLIFFFLCVGLGVASIVVLRSVVQEVRATLTREARALIAADVVVQSGRELTGDVAERVGVILTSPAVATMTEVVETQTMATPVEGVGNGGVKLVELRGVEDAYPFYGAIELDGGRPYAHALLEGHGAIVQPELLIALDVAVGDSIRLAGQPFRITGVIARDRIQRNGIAFGPRVYVDLADLRRTSLLGFGSRAAYQRLLRVPDASQVGDLTARLRDSLSGESYTSVRSWQTLEDRIGQNLSTAENYLSLVGFAVVVLGGLGVWSVTRVIVQQKIRSVAVLKCLGASGGSALAISTLQVLALAAAGSVLGVGIAAAGLAAIPAGTLEALGVTHVPVTVSAAVQGAAVGLLVSLLFAIVPLLEIRDVKPLLLLRAHLGAARRRDWRVWAAGAAALATLALVAMWQAGSIRAGAYVSIALAIVAAALYLASVFVVRLTRPLARSSRVALRHATISLARPGNQTRVIVMSVGLGCFFIVGVRAMQTTLLRELSVQVGQSSPDFVLIDIQRDQIARVRETVAPYLRAPVRIVPLVRGRVVAVSGAHVDLPTVDAVRTRRGLGREFGLTFRASLESNERITAGEFWASPLEAPVSDAIDTDVSIEQQLADDSGLSIGDVVRFDLAGVPVRARITSVRHVAWDDSQNGGFVFVLRPAPAVTRAAQSYVGFVQARDDASQRGALQRDLVRAAPNVSAIDVRDVIASIRAVVDNVTLGVTIVGLVTLAGGILILVGAVAMTKFQRVYEAAIYRTLGASTGLVAAMLAAEYGLLGLLAGTLGACGGLALSWALSRYLFHIAWEPLGGLLAAGIAVTAAAVCAIGVLASLDVLLKKPLATLRGEQ